MIRIVVCLLILLSGPLRQDRYRVPDDCTLKGKKLYGRVQIVNAFPDLKVQVVNAFPDLKVLVVKAFPDECGKWQMVDNFPDLKVQMVDAFPDLKIQYVDAFPGRTDTELK